VCAQDIIVGVRKTLANIVADKDNIDLEYKVMMAREESASVVG
jgi:hypothetical protein